MYTIKIEDEYLDIKKHQNGIILVYTNSSKEKEKYGINTSNKFYKLVDFVWQPIDINGIDKLYQNYLPTQDNVLINLTTNLLNNNNIDLQSGETYVLSNGQLILD